MTINQLTQILTILLVTFNLLMMEETPQSPPTWNDTHSGNSQHRRPHSRSYNKDKVHENESYKHFNTILTGYLQKHSNTIDNNGRVNVSVISNNLGNMSNVKTDDVTTKTTFHNIHLTTENPTINPLITNSQYWNLRGRSTRTNSLRRLTNLERALKSCGNDCNSIWNPVYNFRNHRTTHDKSLLVNRNLYPKSYNMYEKPSLMQPNTDMHYKSDNYWPNQFPGYTANNIIKKNNCSGSLYRNQSCSMSTDSNANRRYDRVRANKNARRIYNTEFQSQNRRKHVENPFIQSSNNRQYSDDQLENYSDDSSDWSNQPTDDGKEYYSQMPPPPPPTDDHYKDQAVVYQEGEKWHDSPSGIGNPPEDDQNAPENGQYSGNTATVGYDKDHYDDGFRWYPNSHHDDDYNKWHYKQDDVSKYEDKRALSRLQDMYYCSKYCHCCRKRNKHVTLKYHDYGMLGKFLSIMKYFGFKSGYDFFYGRSAEQRSDSTYNPMAYFKNYYEKFYGPLQSDELMDDESFMFFNKENGEPDNVSDCKEVCECCEDNKKEKLKKKFEALKIKEAKRKKKLQGLAGIIRYLIFSDEDGYYDFVDGGKSKGRSYSGNYYNSLRNNHQRKYEYQPGDYDMNAVPDVATYDPELHQHQSHGDHMNLELQNSDPNHAMPDVHHQDDHDHDVEEHHPKLILFDCSKCCRFCKKSKDKPRRKRGKRKKKLGKGLLDFLRGLLTGDFFDDDDGDAGDGTAADSGSDDGKQAGDVSLSYTGGTDYFYDYNNFNPPATAPSSDSSNSTCCFNSSSLNSLIVVVSIALIVIQGFSSVNVIFIVIVPLIFFGLIIIFIFLLLQAIIPIYFIPIFIIVLIIVLIPIFLLVILFFLLLPLFLFPIFFPFILRLSGTVPGNLPSVSCTRHANTTLNCTIGSAINEAGNAYYADDTTDAIDYLNGTFETTTAIPLVDYESLVDVTDINLATEGRQMKIPDSLYWKINSLLGREHCLERAGCHLAIYTNSVRSYNRFIYRILENLSLSINETKFIAYKDAYQIGSLNITNHEKCATLYYCKKIKKRIKK